MKYISSVLHLITVYMGSIDLKDAFSPIVYVDDNLLLIVAYITSHLQLTYLGTWD